MSTQVVAIVSQTCTNCSRFIDAQARTPSGREQVRIVDVATIPESQRGGLTAVPTLILPTGRRLVGTEAFKWLDQFATDIEPDAFGGFGALPFSDLSASIGFADFDRKFSDIHQ